MDFYTNDSIRLDYQDRGKGQPVVLVEGFGGYQEIWSQQVDYLLDMNCRVITYDHRNHGHSQRTKQGLKIDQLATDLVNLVKYLQLKRPILIGHSMGASVCYAYLEKSHNIKAMMSIDQSPKMLNDSIWPYGFTDYTLGNYQTKASKTNTGHETLHGLDRRVISQLDLAKRQTPFDRVSSLPLLFDHFQQDWIKTLVTTQIPISLVVAEQSPYFDPQFAKVLADKSSLIKQIELSNCGHDIMAEIPDEFNQSLRHFIFSNLRN